MIKGLLLLFMSTCFIFITPNVSMSNLAQDHQVESFANECSKVFEEWSEVTSVKGEKLYNYSDEVIGEIYRVYSTSKQNGYVLYLKDTGITEAAWEGRDRAQDIEGRVYYVMPGKFFNRE